MTATDPIIAFYQGTGKDAAGRTIEDVWSFDYRQLEGVHDYIQWLFPSARPSQYNPDAPLLNAEVNAAFAGSIKLRRRLKKSLKIMLDFYGLTIVDEGTRNPRVIKAENYDLRRANWQDAEPGYLNHNLLRLTRILECTRTLGLGRLARPLCACLEEIQTEVPDKIPAKTAQFWRQAADV